MTERSKRVLITGSGSGIGRDTAYALAARDHRVYATTHTEGQAALWRSKNLKGIESFKLDITDPQDRDRAEALEVDVLINNAAVGEAGSLADIPLDRVRRTFEANLFGTLALTQIVLKGMIARRRGTIVIVSSLVGRIPSPFTMAYAMTKFSLSAAAAALRSELGELNCGVNVCVVEPGAYHTGFNQRLLATKYEWSDRSYFRNELPRLRAREERVFAFLELRSTRSIVTRFVKATEAERPRLRYSAPLWQSIPVKLMRALGV